MHTHHVTRRGGVVVKRFTTRARGEPEREWRALNLLAEYAPDLAPVPLAARLDVDPAVVRMSRLDGTPLSELRLDARHLDALAAALGDLHDCVPVGELPVETPLAETLADRVRALTTTDLPASERTVTAAYAAGVEWLRSWHPSGAGVTPVFGIGDHNLANFLWDGERVRVVDFEDSGRSDVAFEVAGLVEHAAVWHDVGIAAEDLIARFPLSAAELARLRDLRRLLAVFWLVLHAHDRASTSPRKPPGTDVRQARRLVGLLRA